MAVLVFLLYAITLAPTTGFWDASEYIATAHILGIPHPPGNPLFVALARSWELILAPMNLSVAVRINLFAAATSAASSGFLYLIAHRVWVGAHRRDEGGEEAVPGSAPWSGHLAAGAAALLGATAFTVWSQSTLNEKVYTVSLLIMTSSVWLALRWYDRRAEAKAGRLLLLAIYLSALGATSHLMSLLALPAIAVLVVLSRPALGNLPRNAAAALALVTMGLSFNLVLPIRAAQRPAINEGDPICAEFGAAVVTALTMGGSEACPALAASLRREQYAKPPVTDRQAPWGAQFAMLGQYFDWQWARGWSPSENPAPSRTWLTALFGVLGLLGLGLAFRGGRPVGWALAVLTFTLTVGLVGYLNFRYGYSWPDAAIEGAAREVRERDYFFIAAFHIWGMLAGLGIAGLWEGVSSRVRFARPGLAAAPILLLATVPLFANSGWAGRGGDFAARDWAWDLLQSVPPHSILFTSGDNDTFPLWYLQEVEGVRRDVTVVVDAYLYTDWYPWQLVERTDPVTGTGSERVEAPALFGEAGPAPASPLLQGTRIELDAIEGGLVPGGTIVPLAGMSVELPEGLYLDRAERLAFQIILENYGVRPIYFASSAGVMRRLLLDTWAVREGLTVRLALDGPDGPDTAGLVLLPASLGGEWLAFERTRALAEEVYLYRGLEDREVWADPATRVIPRYFEALFYRLAEGGDRRGAPPADVDRWERRGAAFQISARGGRMLVAAGESDDAVGG